MSVLEVEGLCKSFGEARAVDHVSFTVGRGSSLALVGESGSGKTTVARMVVGLLEPSAGRIRCCGGDRSLPARSRRQRRARAREAQIVFQSPYASLDPRQTAAAAIEEVLRLHHRDRFGTRAERRGRVAELAELVGLDARETAALPAALSGGQRQRVAIARALAAEPQLLILDEAVAALDVSIQAQILNVFADVRERTGISYLVISHDLGVVRQLSEETVVMRAGRVVERGPTATVLDRPEDPYTKRLRECVPGPGWSVRGPTGLRAEA